VSNLFVAGLPMFGMLASLFIGFYYIAFSKSRRAEQIGYLFLAGGVAWVITTGAVLWPQMGHPDRAASLPRHYALTESIA